MPWFKYRGKVAPARRDWQEPTATSHSGLLESLYAWERRARGYDLYPAPVALEPAFYPFDPEADADEWSTIPQPPCRVESGSYAYLSLLMPVEPATPSRRDLAAQGVSPAQVIACLGALRSLQNPLALEIVAASTAIRYQIGCSRFELSGVVSSLAAQFPSTRLEETPDLLVAALQDLDSERVSQRIVDSGLGEAAYRPLPFADKFDPDPHGALIPALGHLESGEVAGIQLLLIPAHENWGRGLEQFLAYFDGDGSGKEAERAKTLSRKLSTPLWCASLKLFAFNSGRREGRGLALERCLGIAGSLASDPDQSGNGILHNRLLALDDAGYETPQADGQTEHLRDLISRRSRRSGMLLAANEINGLWHPPSPCLQHARLLRFDPSRRELPEHLRQAEGAALGVLDSGAAPLHAGEEPTLVPWPDAYRNRHAYLLGATRMGKSTLLGNLIAQDMVAGRGLCLIDPHGDLGFDVLRAVPPHREQDVLFLDLSDTAFPVSLGLLQARDEWEKRLLVSDLLSILHRLFASSWGDRLEHILRHALLTLLADESEPHTLRDIRPLLAEPAYRDYLLPHIADPDLRSFWTSEFPSYNSAAFAPVYNKLGLLLSSPLVRNIVAGGSHGGGKDLDYDDDLGNRLDPAAIISGRRILIVNLAQSLIGEDNAHFLGALLVSKIQLAAMHGLRQGRGERTPFTLYVDEFQNFVVSSFAKILSEAGKAGLSLVMANQFLEQLNEGLQTAILSNVGALVSFRVSAASGRRLEGEFGGHFGARDLTDLERGQAIARLGKAGDSFGLHTFAPLQPEEVDADPGAPSRIVARTHCEVCRPRAEVEAGLRESEARLVLIRSEWQEEQDRKKRGAKSEAKAEENGGRGPKTQAKTEAKTTAKDKAASEPGAPPRHRRRPDDATVSDGQGESEQIWKEKVRDKIAPKQAEPTQRPAKPQAAARPTESRRDEPIAPKSPKPVSKSDAGVQGQAMGDDSDVTGDGAQLKQSAEEMLPSIPHRQAEPPLAAPLFFGLKDEPVKRHAGGGVGESGVGSTDSVGVPSMEKVNGEN